MDKEIEDEISQTIDKIFGIRDKKLKVIAEAKARALYKLGTNPELSENQYVEKFIKDFGL